MTINVLAGAKKLVWLDCIVKCQKWKYIISYQSVALLTAKKNIDATVISLLNLYDWNDEKWKNNLESEFKSNGILMPKTFEELKEILGGEKNGKENINNRN